MGLLSRYLTDFRSSDRSGRDYLYLGDQVELNAFCLMPNHFHLLLYQIELDGITQLLHRVTTAYTMYFNKKYQRLGPLFQDIFRAKHIIDDAHALHISRYIHQNPEYYRDWPYSSLGHYYGTVHYDWIKAERVLELFDYDILQYDAFLHDYYVTQ